jgi:hypothetical protein
MATSLNTVQEAYINGIETAYNDVATKLLGILERMPEEIKASEHYEFIEALVKPFAEATKEKAKNVRKELEDYNDILNKKMGTN